MKTVFPDFVKWQQKFIPRKLKMLTFEQIRYYQTNGYLIIPDFYSPQEMKSRSNQLLNELPTDKKTLADTDYLLASAEGVGYFFEDDLSTINKIGHGLHLVDPVFAKYTFMDQVTQVCSSFNFVKPQVLQSMLIPKLAGNLSPVNPHRDHTFLYTNPAKTIGFWIALDDATWANGCLEFVPGSHKDPNVTKRWIRADNSFKYVGSDPYSYSEEQFVPAEVKAGSLILIDGDVVHKSAGNGSCESRNAYTFHVIERFGTEFPKENWLHSEQGYF